jgi:hypothetical protein
MMRTSSAIIVTINPSINYAKLCMSMRLSNARYSACVRVRFHDQSVRNGG